MAATKHIDELRDEVNAAIGEYVAEFFSLRLNDEGRYSTPWGTKSAIGLGAVVARIVAENGYTLTLTNEGK